MIRQYVPMAVSVIVLAGAGLMGRAVRAQDPPFSALGEVHMVTSPDGMTTAISIDVGDTERPPDAVVDHAFRLQHRTARILTYDGRATISYGNHQLSLETDDHVGLVIAVEGSVASRSDPDVAYSWLTVTGLSHHWGSTIHGSHDDVAALLLATGCAADAGGPACDSCEAGGPGAEGCAIDCDGGSGCSASCSTGSFACCNCPARCWCCPQKEDTLTRVPRRE
jgi:hypothetical protein